jgi:3-oxoacyl-[acyl-carrier protein] reductase
MPHDETPDAESLIIAVTGVSSGVGRALAVELATRGHSVAGMARRTGLGSEAFTEIAASGGVATFVTGDVRNPADCERLIETAVGTYGRIDVLINNAGTVGSSPVMDSDQVHEELWDEIMDTNLKGAFFCSRYALAHMRRDRSGLIVNIASTNAVHPISRMQPYNVSKAGLVHLSRGLAVEYQEYGIRVNAVILGPVADGEAGKATWQALSSYLNATGAPAVERPKPSRPADGPKKASRYLRSSQVARFVATLCEPDSRAMTGAVIAFDGGVSAGLLADRYLELRHR